MPRHGWRRAVLGLGSSLGDRWRALELALRLLAADPEIRVLAFSPVYRTRPMGPARGYFLNAAVAVETRASARGLLVRCRRIEERVGRRPSATWADRQIDLDLLLYAELVRPGPRLRLPHPGLHLRDFALVPARQVAPDMRHPLLGKTLAELPDAPMDSGMRREGSLAPRLPLARARGLHYKLPPPRTRSAPAMKLFLDTANLDEIREAHAWGVIDGVTTNPSLIAREGGNFVDTIHRICEIVQGPVSAETVATDWQGMVREGRLLAQVSEHVVIKVPLTPDGIRATSVLSGEGIDVNVTLCFQPAQALLAAKAGAAYISPFMGRVDDLATDGVQLIEQIVQIYANYPELGTEVLAASIRHPLHLTQVAMAGADVATVPFGVMKKLFKHPLTDLGIKAFLDDWATVPNPDIVGQVEAWLAQRDQG